MYHFEWVGQEESIVQLKHLRKIMHIAIASTSNSGH